MRIKEKYIRLLGIPTLSFLIPFVFGSDNYWHSVLVGFCYTLLFWQGVWMIVDWMRKKYPSYEQTTQRIIHQSIASIVLITIFSPACYALGLMEFSLTNFFKDWIVSIVITSVVSSLYESAYFLEKWRETLLEAEKLKRENIESQFETLKNQVNPHFLFNSFNTLVSIIPENQQLAVEFVEKLSNVYRYVLQNKDKELVPLQTELEFAEAYLFLHKIRFGNNLKVNIDVPQDYLNTSIAPLSLQILLENAIKHNIISISKPLTIDIYIENGNMVVKNNLQMKSIKEHSTKIGLQNIINRYKYLTDRAVEVINTTANFIVALPLLQVDKPLLSHESTDY